MAQHDQHIDDGTGAEVRADLNAAFAAVFSSSSGSLPPIVTVAGQLWFDPDNDQLHVRNMTNTAWDIVTADFDPANIYTKTAADARFLPINGAYTKTESDARFAPIGTRYTKPEIDARFNPFLDPVFVPSAAPTKKTHFDFSLITAGQDRAIKVPNINTTIGGWELIADEIVTGGLGFNYLNLDPFHTLSITGDMAGVTATDAAGFAMYFSSDNGANWIQTANQYDGFNYANPQTATAASGSRSTLIRCELTTGNQTSLNMGVQFDMMIYGFNRANRWKRGRMETAYQVQGSGAVYALETMFGCPALVVCNALRFVPASGTNPWSGRLTLHGLRG